MAEKMSDQLLAQKILELVGGASNVVTATNCMTRLRLLLKNEKLVKTDELKKVMGVLGLISEGTLVQVVLGPGKVKKVADEFNELLTLTEIDVPSAQLDEEARKKKELLNAKLSNNKFIRFFQKIGIWFKTVKWKKGLRHVGNCFSSLIPGFIFFGICYSVSVIINVCLTPDISKGLIDVIANKDALPAAGVVSFMLFRFIAIGFMDYLAIFVGINAAKEFGVTPVIGGAIGGLSIVPSLAELAKTLGMNLWNSETNKFIYFIEKGNGGVLAVILAVFLIGFLERFIRKHMPNVLDTVFTPLLTMVIGGTVFLFGIMPVVGIITTGITKGIQAMSTVPNVFARISIGFVLGAIFLPIISLGLHHGLTPFYAELATKPGGLVLYPIFAMNDACQVGVAASIWLKAKKTKHERLQQNIAGGIVPQILGISEPLIYGMTLPMGAPYLPIAIGAGIGGAWINAWGVGFCSFDCSGLMGIPLCMYVNGKINPGLAIGLYVCGWAIAVVAGFFLAMFMIKPKHLDRIPR